jgi:hypothetical protein
MSNSVASILFKIGLLSIILAGIVCHPSPSNRSNKLFQAKLPQPEWEIDLKKFGYQGRPPVLVAPEDTEGPWTYEQGVIFTESNVVAAFFIVRDDPSGTAFQPRRFSPSDRFRLAAAFFNSENGEFIKKLDWPVTPGQSSVHLLPATKGRFIVGIGNTLSLYSPDFKIIAERTTNSEIAATSPSGETVLLGNTQLVASQWTEQFDLLETRRTDGAQVLEIPSTTEPDIVGRSNRCIEFSFDHNQNAGHSGKALDRGRRMALRRLGIYQQRSDRHVSVRTGGEALCRFDERENSAPI